MRLTYEQRDLLLHIKDGRWYHPADLGAYTVERFYLRDRRFLETSEPMMLVTNYRITASGRDALYAQLPSHEATTKELPTHERD